MCLQILLNENYKWTEQMEEDHFNKERKQETEK